jgi:hypothetical protein
LKVSYKIKVFLHLLFPLFVFILFQLILSTTSSTNTDVAEKVVSDNNTSDGFKVLLFNYIFFALPHYIILFLSLIKKTIKPVLLYLMSASNIVLISSVSCIAYLKYLKYVDLSLLWIFYLPISLFIILLTFLVVKEEPNKYLERNMKP